jgi:hypothetical protein
MATYTEPVEKSWVMDTYEEFAEGATEGAEIENPDYTGKIVLECLLGENLINTQERPWNPGFEVEDPLVRGKPRHWRFEEPSTGSTYVQEAEEPFEGEDYVKLADEGEHGREIHKVGRLILDPEGGNPDELDVDADLQKTFTIRYHGKYENPEEFGFRGPTVNMDVQEDEAKETVGFDPFTEGEEYPDWWARSDFRLPPSEGTPLDPDKYDIRVGPYIATSSAADYAYAGVVYIITPGLEANLRRLTFADPKNAPAYCHNYESIINNSQLVLRFEHPPWDFRPAVEIYRLNDEILRAYNPPRATIQFKPGWVLSERAPYKPVGRTPRGFVLRAPARGAACFTAPASRFVVEVELAGVGEAADIAVAIDGREVVRERIECDGVVRTPPLSAPPYYRHLAVRCPGPAGARAILINARAIAAE